MKLTKKLQGSILIYAIFIMLIILIIIGMLIMASYLNSNFVSGIQNKEKVIDNVQSGLLLALSKPDITENEGEITLSLFGGLFDTIRISKKRWGIFDLVIVSSGFQNFLFKKMAFVGGFYKTENMTAFYLPDQKRALAVCGNTLIHGKCMLPSAGVKSGQIEGRFYERNNTVYGNVFISESEFPSLRTEIKGISVNAIIKKYIFDNYHSTYIISDITESVKKNSFQEETLIYYDEGPTLIRNTVLEGNIIIISETKITVDSSAVLTDVILCAPVIRIKKNYKGSLQCIASDSITLDGECYLKYPSVLFLNHSSKDGQEYLQIEEKSRIIGLVIVNTCFDPDKKHISCHISEGASITGQVYCNGFFSIKGNIYGSLYAKGILLKTSSGLYENYLLDAVIDERLLQDYYAGIDLIEISASQKIMKWVY